jgi:hypothetical protein
MENRRHAGARLIAPWRQGQLDSLCGVYSLINALRLLHAPTKPLSQKACARLFRDGVEAACEKHGSVAPVFNGMTVAVQIKVAKEMSKSRALRKRQPALLRDTAPRLQKNADLDQIWDECLRRGDVLLACFHGKIQHHTVLCGLTDKRVFLFDSDGMRCVLRRTLRLKENPHGKLILKSLVPIGLVALSAGTKKLAEHGGKTSCPETQTL